jgi:hypothetical protein
VTSDPSRPLLVTVDTTPPAVTLSAPSSTTDFAPFVHVTAADNVGPAGQSVATVDAAGRRTDTVLDPNGRPTQTNGPFNQLVFDNFIRTTLRPGWNQLAGTWEINANRLHCVGEVVNSYCLRNADTQRG